MNRRGLTNALLYQSRLMLDLAGQGNVSAQADACETACLVLMHRAWMAALCEAAESYGVTLSADALMPSLLGDWQSARPDAWELKDVQAGLRQPGHWMEQLHRDVTFWASHSSRERVKKADPNRIALVQDDNQEPTNRYSILLAELQQWVDEMRAQSDHS
jgi:hypothetical protein